MKNTKILTSVLLALLLLGSSCTGGPGNGDETNPDTSSGDNPGVETVDGEDPSDSTETTDPSESSDSSGETASGEAFTLSEEDKSVLEELGDDLHTVAESDFATTVEAFHASPLTYSGQMYQLTGYYVTKDVDGEQVPTLAAGTEDGAVSIELRLLTVEIPENAHVRITAVVGKADDELTQAALDVCMVESVQ